jgi:alpha-tubulin suppressor-like RCC1 family protein
MQVKDSTGTGTLQGIVELSTGFQHACAVKSDGTLWCWGNNNAGQLGNGSPTSTTLPVQVLGAGGVGFLASVASVSCGDYGACPK